MPRRGSVQASTDRRCERGPESEVGRGAFDELAMQVVDRLDDGCRRAGVAGQVRQRRQVEQATAKVDGQQGDLLG
jgi:hypothetical protein